MMEHTVAHVPVELLQEIFRYFTIDELLNASQICRYWRDVAHGCPTYWRDITFEQVHTPKQWDLEMFKAQLEQSDLPGLNLSLTLNTSSFTTPLVQLVVAHMARVRSLIIRISVGWLGSEQTPEIQWQAQISSILQHPAPLLFSFGLFVDVGSQLECPLPNSESLQEVELSRVYLRPHKDIYPALRRAIFHAGPSTEPAGLVNLFGTFTGLETLELGRIFQVDGRAFDPAPPSSFSTFKLRCNSTRFDIVMGMLSAEDAARLRLIEWHSSYHDVAPGHIGRLLGHLQGDLECVVGYKIYQVALSFTSLQTGHSRTVHLKGAKTNNRKPVDTLALPRAVALTVSTQDADAHELLLRAVACRHLTLRLSSAGYIWDPILIEPVDLPSLERLTLQADYADARLEPDKIVDFLTDLLETRGEDPRWFKLELSGFVHVAEDDLFSLQQKYDVAILELPLGAA